MKEEWIPLWIAEQPLYKQYWQAERLIKHRDKIGNVADKYLVYSESGTVRAFYTKKAYELVQQDGKKLLDEKIAAQTIEDVKQTIADFQTAENTLRSLLIENGPLHSEEFVDKYKKFDTLLLKVFAYLLTTWEATVSPVEQELREKLASEEKFISLTTPIERDLLIREKISLLSVAKNPTKDKIKQHALNYALLYCNIDSEKDVLKLVEENIKIISITALEEEIKNSLDRLEKIRQEQKKTFRELGDKEVERLALLLQEFALRRLELKACWAGVHYYLFPLFERIANETNSTIREVMMFWTGSEILNFLQSQVAPRKGEVKQRSDFYLLYLSDGKTELYSGEKARKIKSEVMEKPSYINLKEIKGNVANRGIARGWVKLIKTDDLRLIEKIAREMKENTVLVTGMTNPNTLPLIRKAIAIVTDEGGITCHAAIISREFNIPCIIGTRIATQVLKDGQEVEVDANKGIVRILK